MMGEKLTDRSCARFAEELASGSPVPGGGGAAAMIGALASALGAMAVTLSMGKKKFLSCEQEHRQILEQTQALRRRFLELVEEDAAAFEPLSRAYSMDKSAPDYGETLRTATLRAARAPYEMLQACCRLAVLLEQLQDKCSVLLLSDLGCAASAARSCMECAAMNVLVNTRLLPGDPEAAALAEETGAALREYAPRAQAVADSVTAFLRAPR